MGTLRLMEKIQDWIHFHIFITFPQKTLRSHKKIAFSAKSVNTKVLKFLGETWWWYVNSTYFRGTKKGLQANCKFIGGTQFFFCERMQMFYMLMLNFSRKCNTFARECKYFVIIILLNFFVREYKVFLGNFWILSQSMALPQEMLYSLTNHLRFFHWLLKKHLHSLTKLLSYPKFCEWMQSFFGKCISFVSEYKIAQGIAIILWEKVSAM